MKRIMIALAAIAMVALSGCDGGDNQVTKDAVAKLIQVGVKSGCAVTPSLGDLGVSLATEKFGAAGTMAASTANTIVQSYIKTICEQWNVKKSISAAIDDACIATVNNVCIRKE